VGRDKPGQPARARCIRTRICSDPDDRRVHCRIIRVDPEPNRERSPQAAVERNRAVGSRDNETKPRGAPHADPVSDPCRGIAGRIGHDLRSGSLISALMLLFAERAPLTAERGPGLGSGVDPADMPVAAAIDDVQHAGGAVAEHHHHLIGEVHAHHRLAD
jgi:hypothetical protein